MAERQWRRIEDRAPVAPENVRWWNGVGYVERLTDRRVEADATCTRCGTALEDPGALFCEYCLNER